MNPGDRYQEIINEMKSDDKQVQWNTMVKWCNLWIDVDKKALKPLLDLIKEFKELGYWKVYYPSQSHYALGLSLGKDYNERYDLPMVYISYNAEDDNFAIQYQKGQGGKTRRVECGSKVSNSNFQEIENWLHDKNKNGRHL